MRQAISAAILFLAVAGCSKGGGDNSSSAASVSQEEPPVNLTIDPNNAAEPVTLPSPSRIAAIPAKFQGRWGTVGLDCNPAKADSAKGLITIAGSRLSFYEARGDVIDLRQATPNRLDFTAAMSGEGQRWSEPTRLTMQDDGRTLIRQATGTPDRAGTFTYQRCPG